MSVPTVVCSIQTLQGVTADSEDGEVVSVTAEELQTTESADIQLLETRIPQVQMHDVDQLLCVSNCHLRKPVQPVRWR